MTGAAGPGVDLSRRVERLAAEGSWPELADRLDELDTGAVLADEGIAYLYGQALFFTGRLSELSDFAASFEASARRRTHPRGIMRALNLAGNTAFELGSVDDARTRYEKLLDLAEAEGDLAMQAHAANNLGAVANLVGRTEEALAFYQMAVPLYQRLGEERGLAQTHHNLGISYRDLGRLEDAAEAHRRAERLAMASDHHPLRFMAMAGRGEVLLRRGDARLGYELATWSLEGARALEDPATEAEALRIRALCAISLDDERSAEALGWLERSARLARSTGNRLVEAETLRDTGRLLISVGRREEAREAFGRALDLFEELGARAEIGRVGELMEDAEES